jgi:hypothetical protein
VKEMNFHEWLKTRGYFPIGVIIENYRSSNMANEDMEKSIENIKNNYKYWCIENGVEPSFGLTTLLPNKLRRSDTTCIR